METDIIISPVLDENIQEHMCASPIWKLAFKEDEITEEIYHLYPDWYRYHVKFQGLKPIQCTKREIFRLFSI